MLAKLPRGVHQTSLGCFIKSIPDRLGFPLSFSLTVLLGSAEDEQLRPSDSLSAVRGKADCALEQVRCPVVREEESTPCLFCQGASQHKDEELPTFPSAFLSHQLGQAEGSQMCP